MSKKVEGDKQANFHLAHEPCYYFNDPKKKRYVTNAHPTNKNNSNNKSPTQKKSNNCKK